MSSYIELARLFLYLGSTSIGGPALHIARMNEEVVERRRWISREEFLDMMAAANLIPGPNSTELALHIGYRRAGVFGLLIAGLCFITPAALFVAGLGWVYVRYGALPATESILYATKPAVLAIIFKAAWDLGKTAIRSKLLLALAIVAAVVNVAGVHELIVLFAAGLAASAARRGRGRKLAALFVVALPAAAAMPVGGWSVFGYFLKVGGMLYGSGYVLIALLRTDLVANYRWLTEQQLLDAVAVGQITPGPLFTTATFIGFLLLGWSGALLATIGIFLPAFVLVFATQPLVRRARKYASVSDFLDGINVAAIALIAVTAVRLGTAALVDSWTLAVFVISALLLAWRIASIWLIAGAVIVGLSIAAAG